MAIVKTITESDFQAEFKHMGRGDQFSSAALDVLFEWYDDLGENFELDVIAICCEWSEYTVDEAREEFSEYIDVDELAEMDDPGEIDDIVVDLSDHTSVFRTRADTILVMDF